MLNMALSLGAGETAQDIRNHREKGAYRSGVEFKAMRKMVLALGISLDGYIARRDGTFDFLFMPQDFSMAEFFASIDTGIMGRKTYDVAKAQGEGGFGPKLKTYVLSRTLPPGEREGKIFVNMSPQGLAEEIRQNQGKDIWLMGGGEMARDFLKADLVDELHLGVVPVLLGEGLPLFPGGFPQRNFELIENKSFSRGLVSLKYRRATSPDAQRTRRTSSVARPKRA
jgi:dihydrofolate reductase